MQIPVQLAAMLVTTVIGIPFAMGLAAAVPIVMAWRAAKMFLRQAI